MNGTVQPAIAELRRLAPQLDDSLDQATLTAASAAIDQIVQPLSTDDLEALVALLPANGDDAYGLNWVVLHGIEAAEDWPRWDLLEDLDHWWVRLFRLRLANAGMHDPRGSTPQGMGQR